MTNIFITFLSFGFAYCMFQIKICKILRNGIWHWFCYLYVYTKCVLATCEVLPHFFCDEIYFCQCLVERHDLMNLDILDAAGKLHYLECPQYVKSMLDYVHYLECAQYPKSMLQILCTISNTSHFVVQNWLREHISIATFAIIMFILSPMWLWMQNVNFANIMPSN